MPPLERSIQASVLNHLKKLRQADPTLAYRKRHGGAMGTAGDPDITGLWDGIHFEIELKAPGENPTLLQLARLAEWRQAGAVTAVVRSLDDLRQTLAEVATRRQCIAPQTRHDGARQG